MKMTQYSIILKHLLENGSITSFEAFSLYGVTRLSAIIFNLRNDGFDIESEPLKRKNRYGNTTIFARYNLIKIP